MALPNKPGRKFSYMLRLTTKYGDILLPTGISKEVMLAIFWEETFFNNVFQTGGTAIGFGQTEPSEFYRFDARGLEKGHWAYGYAKNAEQKGYLVHGLPPLITVGRHPNGMVMKRATAPLTDDQAVQVSFALVRDLFERKLSPEGILHGYAGVGYKGKQAAHLNDVTRKAMVTNFRESAKLLKIETQEDPYYDDDKVLEALQKAKTFHDIAGFREALF